GYGLRGIMPFLTDFLRIINPVSIWFFEVAFVTPDSRMNLPKLAVVVFLQLPLFFVRKCGVWSGRNGFLPVISVGGVVYTMQNSGLGMV
ncbi:MAG: hypothetical protein K1562_20270, partial [Candidatus Thiodiazotropha sp. (ex. Lucinisca nassula)]|nr:hypothetical protein [Candidatus Thiodiazotropha sp. (ex. Lucinisca nassula)]